MTDQLISNVIYAAVIIFGLRILCDTILEIRKMNLEMAKVSNRSMNGFNSNSRFKCSGGISSKIRDLSKEAETELSPAIVTSIKNALEDCKRRNAKSTLELHSESDKTLADVYKQMSNSSNSEEIHGVNFFNSLSSSFGSPYEASVEQKNKDSKEMLEQSRKTIEQFHNSISGNKSIDNYFSIDKHAKQINKCNIMMNPVGNKAPTMKKKGSYSSEDAPYKDDNAYGKSYKIDNWEYENEMVMNGGKFGKLSPFDIFGSDYACV